MSQEQPRPGHATLAGSIIIGCSVIVVLSAWERISTLNTLEAQDALRNTLSDPPMSGLGLTVDGYTSLLRVLCTIGAGAATAAVILGLQVFKRSSSARLALTALSPLILVGGMAAGDLFGPMVVAGVALLWLQPTRDWYAGRPWVQAHEQRRAARLAEMRPPSPPASPDAAEPPRPTTPSTGASLPGPDVAGPPPHDRPFGEPVGEPDLRAVPVAVPYGRPDVVRPARPQPLVAACVLTWITSSLVLLGLGLTAALLPSQAKDLLAELTREEPKLVDAYNIDETSLLTVMYLVLAGFALWTVAAIVLAALAFVGQNWARITLVVSGVSGGLLALVMALGAWPLLTLVVVFALCVRMLLRPEVARWYQR